MTDCPSPMTPTAALPKDIIQGMYTTTTAEARAIEEEEEEEVVEPKAATIFHPVRRPLFHGVCVVAGVSGG